MGKEKKKKSRQATLVTRARNRLARFCCENEHDAIENWHSWNDDISMNIRDIVENSKSNI